MAADRDRRERLHVSLSLPNKPSRNISSHFESFYQCRFALSRFRDLFPGLLRLLAKEEGSTNDWSACIQYCRDSSRGQFSSGRHIGVRLPSACLRLPLPRLYRECIELAMKKKACRRQSSGSSRCFTFSPFSLPLVSLSVYYNSLGTWGLDAKVPYSRLIKTNLHREINKKYISNI